MGRRVGRVQRGPPDRLGGPRCARPTLIWLDASSPGRWFFSAGPGTGTVCDRYRPGTVAGLGLCTGHSMLFLTPLFFVLGTSSRKGPRGPIALVFATTVDQSDIRVLGPHELDSPGASSLYVRASVTSMWPAQGWAEGSPYRTANATGSLGSFLIHTDTEISTSEAVFLVLVPSKAIAYIIILVISILAREWNKSTHQ